MKRIVYYVQCSLDGYIAGPKGDSSMFVRKGSVSDRYREELEKGLIDVLKLRLNPVVLGGGTRLFGHSPAAARLNLISSVPCDGGVQINEYHIEND